MSCLISFVSLQIPSNIFEADVIAGISSLLDTVNLSVQLIKIIACLVYLAGKFNITDNMCLSCR